MTYNEAHFQSELNQQLSGKLDSLLVWQDHVVGYMVKYLVACNGQTQLNSCAAFLHLLAKIRFNLDAANHLLPFLYGDYRFKTWTTVGIDLSSYIGQNVSIEFFSCLLNARSKLCSASKSFPFLNHLMRRSYSFSLA